MGQSLKRLILIWDSIKEYMKLKPQILSGKKKVNYDYFLKLLEDKTFYFKILALSGIIDKLNLMNIKFRNQKMEIQNLKIEIKRCIQGFCFLLMNPNATPSDLSTINNRDWIKIEDQKDNFLSVDSFISRMVMEIDPRLDSLMAFSEAKKRKFVELFQTFLWNILSYLIEYLPFSDSIVNSLDFFLLDNSSFVLKEKNFTFDGIFGTTRKLTK